MDEMQLLAPIAFVVISLMAGALLKFGLAKINLPYTVGLFVLGIIVGTLSVKGFFEATPLINESIEMACNIDPDLILNLFLPILIFSAAYELDVHIFKKTLFNASMLAVPGMVISMFLTAAVMMGIAHYAPAYVNWNWTFALMFGALISATDPVAVVALLQELGVSKRFSTLIDGESMLNDGTGIVLFMLMYAPFTSSVEAAHSSPVMSFLVVVLGGLLIGYLMARAFLYYATRKGVKGDVFLQTSMMILLSYLTFILAQDFFKLSGVIALVAFGLVIAYHGTAKLEERTRHFMSEFWGVLSYIANTLIFIIIGVIIAVKVDFQWQDMAALVVVYIGINIVRMLMITMLYPLLKRSGYGLTKRESIILTWGALRGALGLTLALMVSYTESIPEDIRRQVLLLTAGIVTMTLIINATTIKWMLNKLGLLDSSATRQLMDAEMRARLRAKSSDYLAKLRKQEEMQSLNDSEWQQIVTSLPQSCDIPTTEPTKEELVAGLRMKIIARQRQELWSTFSDGVISEKAYRKLIGELDEMVDIDGREPLDKRLDSLGLAVNDAATNNSPLRKNAILRLFCFKHNYLEPIVHYEIAYGTLLAERSSKQMVDNIKSTLILTPEQQRELESIGTEVDKITQAAQSFIENFKSIYPDIYSEALVARAERMLHNYESAAIEEMVSNGILDSDSAETLRAEINKR